MHQRMRGKRRFEGKRLTRVRAHRLDAPAGHVALIGQQPHRVGIGAGHVRAIGLHIEEQRRVGALRPVRAHQHPAPGRDFAVPRLPRQNMRRRQQKLCVRRRLFRTVNDAGGRDKALRRDGVGITVGQILAGHPMNRRVKMRAGMLAAGKIVPVPGRSALVVARDFRQFEGLCWMKRRRQLDHRRRGFQNLGQVNDADRLVRKRGCELCEQSL